MKPAPYLFFGPNSLYGAFGGKIVPDENFAQFSLKIPLEFVFPKNTFSVWIFVLNRTSPISWLNGLDGTIGGKSVLEWSFVHPKKQFSIGIFWWNQLHTSFLGLIRYMVRSGQNCSGRKLCSILPQKPSRIRFSKKHVFGLNFCTKSHLTYFLG